jgi:hypothetical protein
MPDAAARSRQYRIAFAALMLTVCAVFWRHLFTSDVLFYRDITFASYPRAVELRNIVRSGSLPIWNPYEHFGEPVIANPDYLLFYPTAWLAWVLPAAYGFKLHFVLHYFLLAAGGFLLARRLGRSPFACYLAGALFVFSGPVMSLGNFSNMVAAAAWMAPALLGCDYLMRRGGWRGATLFAAALALQFMAGEPFTSLITVALALAWCVVFAGAQRPSLGEEPLPLASRRTGGSLRSRLCFLASREAVRHGGLRSRLCLILRRFVPACLLAFALSAIQLLPAARHLPETARSQLPFEHSFFWSLDPLKLLEVLIPRVWGDAFAHVRLPWLLLEGREAFLLSVFIGIIPLGLAAAGLLLGRNRLAWFWSAVAVVCVLAALGNYTPLGWVLYYVVPVFRIFRFPEKLMIPTALAVAQLAALGSDALLGNRLVAGGWWLVGAEPNDSRRRFPRRSLAALEIALLLFAAAWLALSASVLLAPARARAAATRISGAVFTEQFVAWIIEQTAHQATRNREGLDMDRTEAVERAARWLMEVVPTRLPYVLLGTLLLAAILRLHRRVWGRWLSAGQADGIRRFQGETIVTLLSGLVWFAGGAAVIQSAVNHYGLIPLASARYFSDRSPVLDSMSSRQPPPRIFAEPAQAGIAVASLFSQEMDFLPPAAQFNYGKRLSLVWAAGTLGVETTFSDDPEQLLEHAHADLQHFVYRIGQYEPIERLLALGSVEYAVLPAESAVRGPGWGPVELFLRPPLHPVRAYRLVNSVPRAYLVAARAAEILPTGRETIDRLVSNGFDLRRQVVLEHHAFSDAELQASTLSLSELAGEAAIVSRSATRVETEASPLDPAYLVLTDSYDPDWVVSVDGKRAPVLRANQIFRAVPLSAGKHRLVFTYRPVWLFLGAALTLAAAGLAALFLVRETRRQRSAATAPAGGSA